MANRIKYPIHPDFKRWANMDPPLGSSIVRECVDRRIAFLMQALKP